MLRSDFEIMAPVGSRESLYAAFQAGADAVYFGVGKLNMRAHSANAFTIDDLREIAELCRDKGVKSYLTVNTIVYDEELDEMRRIVNAAKAAGISAIIASDAAVLGYAKKAGVEVHLSTQMNISNTEALRFYSAYADVAVLARELNLKQVKRIHDAIVSEPILGPSGQPMRIEMFCHGALCLAVSGKCFMSLGTRGESANRGQCLQTCRRSYLVKDKTRDIELEVDNEYIMSPKDLKTIGFLDRMIDAGVRVFKIEGRARGPEYVRTVVECYDEAIRTYIAGEWDESCRTKWDAKLAAVFNRGFWEGYYLGAPVADITNGYGTKATEKKFYVGKCVNFFVKPSITEFVLEAGGFKKGEKLLITGPTTGAAYAEPTEIFADEKPADSFEKKDDITFKVPERVRPGDKLYVIRTREA